MDAVDAIGRALPFVSLRDIKSCALVSHAARGKTRESPLWSARLSALEQDFPLDGTCHGTHAPDKQLPEAFVDPRHLASYKEARASTDPSRFLLCCQMLHLYRQRVRGLLSPPPADDNGTRAIMEGYATHAHGMVTQGYALLPAGHKAELLARCTVEQGWKTASAIATEDFGRVGMRHMEVVPYDKETGQGGIFSLAATVAEYSWQDALDLHDVAFTNFIERMFDGVPGNIQYRNQLNPYAPGPEASPSASASASGTGTGTGTGEPVAAASGEKRKAGWVQTEDAKAASKRLTKEKQEEEEALFDAALHAPSVSAELKEFAANLKRLKAPALKELCIRNNQMRSGSKTQLAWRLLAVKLHGAAGLCPRCDGGIKTVHTLQLKYDGQHNPKVLVCKNTTCKGRCGFSQDLTPDNQGDFLDTSTAFVIPDAAVYDSLRGHAA